MPPIPPPPPPPQVAIAVAVKNEMDTGKMKKRIRSVLMVWQKYRTVQAGFVRTLL
jgi:hypothetical protein